ncbi:tetratricopeptide repeat protein [Streptomyces sp. RKAG293]|uniref:tetratricopeptide repeat protein n=1 Tax=Streptomyces sp. RKAG293 TaxID=2893403 RepID=UPI0020332DDC|nr:tetratricopeptide repeat protein [Streptomyces sp. RKAG293]MCM2423249.1 tetratricopeptide repeat protein [Streptomyces sp. RKAG293]
MTADCEGGPGRVEQHAEAFDHAVITQVAGDQNVYLPVHGPAPRALHSLPAVHGTLIGRDDEIQELLDLLDPGNEGGLAVVVSAIAGLPGVGKTTLALHAANRAVELGWFPGGHLFLDLRGYDPVGKVTAGQALGALLRALCGADADLPVDPEEQAAVYRSQLAARVADRGPVLLVLDSASSAAQVEPLLPGGHRHRVLVTSRHTLASLPASLIDLTVLQAADAANMIKSSLIAANRGDPRPAREPEALAQLAERCGFLPLALQITAANLMVESERSLADLAGELKDEQARLALSYSDDEQTLAVRASFELSYRRLPPEQAQLFRLLSLNPTAQVSLEAAAVLTAVSVGQSRSLVVKLAQAHLIEPVGEQRWRMHDLLRLYARELADRHIGVNDQEEAFDRLLEYYRTTAGAADDHLCALPGDSLPERFPGRMAALAWLDGERLNLVAAVTLAVATARPRIAMSLTEHLAVFLNQGRYSDDAITTGQHALTAARELGDRDGEGRALNNLGSGLMQARRFEEAVDAHTRAATIHRELGNQQREGAALNNLGLVLREVRRFEEALEADTRDLAICRDLGDRHGEGRALNNLGCGLLQARRFEEAVDAHTRAAGIHRELGDRHSEGMALNNLGLVLREAGRFEEAIEAHTQDLTICRELGEGDSEGTALNNLGLVLREVRRFEEAVDAHTRAAAICRELGDRQGEGMALNNLGLVLREVRQLEEAVDVLTRAAVIFRELGDQGSQGTAFEGMVVNNLAVVQREARRFRRMRRLWRAVMGRGRSIGNGRPR